MKVPNTIMKTKNKIETSLTMFSPNEYFWDKGNRRDELKKLTIAKPSHQNMDKTWDLAQRILSDIYVGRHGVALVANPIKGLQNTASDIQSLIWQMSTSAEQESEEVPLFTQMPFVEILIKYCDKYGKGFHYPTGIKTGFIQPMLKQYITKLVLLPDWEKYETSSWEKKFFCSMNKRRSYLQFVPPKAA